MSSCSEKFPLVNSELICPNHFRILVKFTKAEDLKEAIYQNYLTEKNSSNPTPRDYTIARLKDGRTLAFNNLAPEVAITCVIQESYVGFADRSYIYHPNR